MWAAAWWGGGGEGEGERERGRERERKQLIRSMAHMQMIAESVMLAH